MSSLLLALVTFHTLASLALLLGVASAEGASRWRYRSDVRMLPHVDALAESILLSGVDAAPRELVGDAVRAEPRRSALSA